MGVVAVHGAARDGSRGRTATHPLEVPARGWKDVLFRVWKNIGKDRVLLVGAGVTFYIILSLFPAIAALVALYGVFADPTTISSHLDSIADLVPAGALDVIRDQITRVASQGRTTLGLTFMAGLLALLWSANAGVKSLFDALSSWSTTSWKSAASLWLNVISLTFTVVGLFVLVVIGAMVVVPLVLNFIGLGGATETIIKLARWPALLIVVTLAIAFLYRYGPSREKPQWRWITIGQRRLEVMLDRMHELEKRGDEKGKREACQVAAMAAPYARAASHCLAAADGAGLTDALLAREAAGSAAAPGRRPGSSREMQFCRTFGRNHLLRSVL